MGMLFAPTLTVEQGYAIQLEQVEYYAEMARSNYGEEAESKFRTAVSVLNSQNPNPQTGYGVPRGADIEFRYVSICKGYSPCEMP
jgi:hypothetical protein